jgi:ABC-type branched-subunit amino acid transport system substrate-binding protein
MTGIRITRRAVVRLTYLLVAGLFVAAAGASPSRAEEQGVTNQEIVIGMSNALTGPASALGTGVKAGAMTYFQKINNAGGGERPQN